MVVEHPRRRWRRIHSRGRGVRPMGAAHGAAARRHRREVPVGLAALRRGHKKPSRGLEGIRHGGDDGILRRRLLAAEALRGDVGRHLANRYLARGRRLLTFEQFLDRMRRGRDRVFLREQEAGSRRSPHDDVGVAASVRPALKRKSSEPLALVMCGRLSRRRRNCLQSQVIIVKLVAQIGQSSQRDGTSTRLID